jgi:uncharacterized iron-regulated protein
MIRTILLLCAVFMGIMAPLGAEAADIVSWYTNEGKNITRKEAIKALDNYDVILFGEFHDQTAIHEEELAFFAAYTKKHSKSALSLEMIEKDNASLVQKYLSGALTREDFIKSSRPWPNYEKDYAPIVDLAKERKLDVIASNVPRYIATQYARTGSLDGIAEKDRIYLPTNI